MTEWSVSQLSIDNLPDDVRAEIAKEIKARRKVSAIKLYKDATGLSLLESKKAVEAIARQVYDNTSGNSSDSDEILDAIFQGEKLKAIKLYRDSSGVSLREAKEFVEDLTDQLRVEASDQFKNGSNGCLGSVALAIAVLLCFLLTLARGT